jgi:hypothetical protein
MPVVFFISKSRGRRSTISCGIASELAAEKFLALITERARSYVAVPSQDIYP